MRTPFLYIIYLLVITTFYACGTYYAETSLDKNWGKSFETARQNQILNPAPADPTAPVEGVDGTTAASIMDQYHSGFKSESSQENVNIIKLR